MKAYDAYKILKHAAWHCRTVEYPDGIIREVTVQDWKAAEILTRLAGDIGTEEYERTQLKRAKKYFSVRCIRLNQGGYDRRGRYFGTGAPLFEWSYWDPKHDLETGGDTRECRAESREYLLLKLARKLPPHLS